MKTLTRDQSIIRVYKQVFVSPRVVEDLKDGLVDAERDFLVRSSYHTLNNSNRRFLKLVAAVHTSVAIQANAVYDGEARSRCHLSPKHFLTPSKFHVVRNCDIEDRRTLSIVESAYPGVSYVEALVDNKVLVVRYLPAATHAEDQDQYAALLAKMEEHDKLLAMLS